MKRERPAVWLVHALGACALQWEAARGVRELAGFDVVARDLPGAGGTSPVPGVTLEQLASELAERVARSPSPVVLVGHSLGGVVATLAAELAPAGLAGVINVEGNLTLADCGVSAAAAEASDFGSWFEKFIRDCEGGSAGLRRYAEWLRRHDRATFLAYSRDLVRVSRGSAIGLRYAALTAPHIYLRGDQIPEESRAFIATHQLAERVVADASHIFVWERPVAFSAALAQCLTDLDA